MTEVTFLLCVIALLLFHILVAIDGNGEARYSGYSGPPKDWKDTKIGGCIMWWFTFGVVCAAFVAVAFVLVGIKILFDRLI